MLSLSAGEWTATVDPALGGALLSLRRAGRDVLRAAPAGIDDPLDAACFPLLPYANRIAGAQFLFQGKPYAVRRNFGDHPHSLHGVGWQQPWAVMAQDACSAHLTLDYPGGEDWPWRFRGDQELRLGDEGLRIVLTLANIDDEEAPAGIGLHPYFPIDADARLTMKTGAVWLTGDTQIPVQPAPAGYFADWASGDELTHPMLIDNCYEGWDGQAILSSGGARTTIGATGAGLVHLFVPPGQDFICVEPVSHMPDAVHRGGMPTLGPGESMTITMDIRMRA